MKAEQLVSRHPLPWSIDQMNAAGVLVVDSRGESVFEEWFGECPDELSGERFAEYVEGRHLFALWLIEWASSANTEVSQRRVAPLALAIC